jgi:hypothetical protein
LLLLAAAQQKEGSGGGLIDSPVVADQRALAVALSVAGGVGGILEASFAANAAVRPQPSVAEPWRSSIACRMPGEPGLLMVVAHAVWAVRFQG